MVSLKVDVLRREVARRNWTLTELARRIKTNPAYISHLLSGLKEPGPSFRSRVMKELEMGFDDLFTIKTPTRTGRR